MFKKLENAHKEKIYVNLSFAESVLVQSDGEIFVKMASGDSHKLVGESAKELIDELDK